MVSFGENDNILRSPHFIHELQSFFGIEKLEISRNSDDNDWISVRATEVSNSIKNGHSHSIKHGEKPEKNIVYYRINNKFWYYLFLFGTQLGEEPFCALFFSLWFWNLDASIGRRLVLVWNLIMYIGQYLKDLIRWDRPGMPTVVQLQTKWSLEYGMPSTHAMLGVAVPGAVFFYTVSKYNIDKVVALGLIR
jgi:sphingosine-1-phosphate phosphatase 1